MGHSRKQRQSQPLALGLWHLGHGKPISNGKEQKQKQKPTPARFARFHTAGGGGATRASTPSRDPVLLFSAILRAPLCPLWLVLISAGDQEGADERFQVAVEDAIGVAYFHFGAKVFHHAIRMQDVRTNL